MFYIETTSTHNRSRARLHPHAPTRLRPMARLWTHAACAKVQCAMQRLQLCFSQNMYSGVLYAKAWTPWTLGHFYVMGAWQAVPVTAPQAGRTITLSTALTRNCTHFV